MRCYICTQWSLAILCTRCTKELLQPTPTTRLLGGIEVISFYTYAQIESLLLTKHKPQGYRIYKALAEITMVPFIKNFIACDEREIYLIGVDEYIKNGYAHVAVLSHAMKSKSVIPLHYTLKARNRAKYAGKSLEFRTQNPRDFVYTGKSNIDAILVDDIITTGLTLDEASIVLEEAGVNVLFALTLADVLEQT